MKTIGIKLADGSFYPVLEEGKPVEKSLDLTTAHNNQTKVMVDLYRSETCSMEDAEYVDSLQIENLMEHPNGEPSLSFTVAIDENNKLSARMSDPETGEESKTNITLVSRTIEERLQTDEYNISDTIEGNINDLNIDVPEESEPVIGEETAVDELADNFDIPDTTLESTEIPSDELNTDNFNLDDTLSDITDSSSDPLADFTSENETSDDTISEAPLADFGDISTENESSDDTVTEDPLADFGDISTETES